MNNIYLYMVAATLLLGWLLPQKGPGRKQYILLMTLLHIFVSGFRYFHLTGDLMKYHHTFLVLAEESWFSETLFNNGRNFGFYLFLKLIYQLTGGNFQAVLFSIAVIIHLILGYIIGRYSPAPWMSYLVWNCLAFYLLGFSALKQSMAMAFVMLSFDAIVRKKPGAFLVCMAFAGAMHMPALVFLPAYFICRIKMEPRILLVYVLFGTLFFLFKEPFVRLIQKVYYQDGKAFFYSGSLGSRFIMILGFFLFSFFFCGFRDPIAGKLAHLMAIAAMLQMLAGFDNVFTRLTDYCFQFSVLYLPMMFFEEPACDALHPMLPLFPFNKRSRTVLLGLMCIFLIWFYYTFYISVPIAYQTDNYINFRFMWDVNP